jgi:hypothetical protein
MWCVSDVVKRGGSEYEILVFPIDKILLHHLGILLSSDFLTTNQISSSQNKNTQLKYSTQ